MFSTAKLAIIGILIISLGGSFWYVSGLRADLQRSQQNVETLKESVERQNSLINQMQSDQKEIAAARKDTIETLNEQRDEINRLRAQFNESADGSERDFGAIALQKPGLVENIINDASTNALRCVEIASGAEPTQEEKDAGIIDDCGFDSLP